MITATLRDPIILRRFTLDEFRRMNEAGLFGEGKRPRLRKGLVFDVVTSEPRPFSVGEYYRLAEIGVLSPTERVELIEGTIYTMSPIGSGHRGNLDFLADELRDRLKKRTIVSTQQPIHLDDHSEPEPDISVVRYRKDYYRKNHPRPEDVFFIVEIMDTSAAYDRGLKLAAYAKAGIPEVWLADLRGEFFEVHRMPVGGVYTVSFSKGRGEEISPEAFPDIALKIDDILG